MPRRRTLNPTPPQPFVSMLLRLIAGLFFIGLITQVHGGAIEVSSAEGKGTTFTITLPVDASA